MMSMTPIFEDCIVCCPKQCRPFGEIEPKATLSGGATGIKIVGDSCWIGNDKIGDLVKW